MGRWKAWALAWLLAATLPALLLQAPSARGDELLVNGGFEDGVEGWGYSHCRVTPVASPLRPETTGSQAIELTGKPSSSLEFYLEMYQDVPVVVGEEYVFSGYYAVRDGAGIEELRLRVIWWYWDGDTMVQVDPVPDDAAANILHDSSYHLLDIGPRVARPNAEFARVKLLVKRAAEDATVYLDDFSFTGPPAPTPTPPPSPTPPPTQTPPPTASPSPTPRPTASPSPAASPSPTASPSPSPGPTASPTPSPVASPSPTAVPTATEGPPAATPSPCAPTPAAGLVNGGFEDADDEGKPLGWRKYGGELQRSAVARREGQFAAAFTSRTASTKWAFQTVAVEGSKAYVLSGYALKNDANVQAAYLRLSWYASPDGSRTAIDSVDSTIRLTDDSSGFRLLTTGPVVAPAEAASAKVRLMLDPLSEAEATVYFDAISFSETTMPFQPLQTPQPSPAFASSESPTASAVVPVASPAQPEPSSSSDPPRPSPTVLGATSDTPQATAASLAGSSQSEAVPEGTPTRTPVVLFRERRTAQSSQGGEGIAAGDEHDGLSPIVLILATAAPAAAAAATAFFVWRRWRKRARPP